ncbi:MAG: hypothetical protein WBL93_04635 [Lutisporaceae bacterium]
MMPIVNVANHFIEINGSPVNPDSKELYKSKKHNKDKQRKK